ncbi:flavodoxin family protein [Nocardia sp. NBC_01499]|uniref:flavodoxin family protein n=1 Tax=Nocardia sp. NBC_01499 TaxID=2903597 RepID=UPI00386F720E
MDAVEVAIVYHSRSGHTAALARAVSEGVQSAGAISHLISVDAITEQQWQHLDDSDAVIFGSSTFMGNVSAEFQRFAESTSKRWYRGAWRDKLAAGFVNSGCKSGDKLHALMSMIVLAGQHGMNWVSLAIEPGWNTSASSENDLNRLGFFLGAAAQSFADVGPDQMHESDLETCRQLGARVARMAGITRLGSLSPSETGASS